MAEKVVHHPTVLAAVCEGVGWRVAADLEVKSKFWGRCIELIPVGRIEVLSIPCLLFLLEMARETGSSSSIHNSEDILTGLYCQVTPETSSG